MITRPSTRKLAPSLKHQHECGFGTGAARAQANALAQRRHAPSSSTRLGLRPTTKAIHGVRHETRTAAHGGAISACSDEMPPHLFIRIALSRRIWARSAGSGCSRGHGRGASTPQRAAQHTRRHTYNVRVICHHMVSHVLEETNQPWLAMALKDAQGNKTLRARPIAIVAVSAGGRR